ncbi:MAG: DUF1120 domain-containing protein [Paraburkholderia sp.]|uniref:DUF1120 domain-containing protein n=1 Tax=Paraburkholderia sp. TaxID=1926495 RepID=UPI0011FB3B7A|nr:DUF1120 domain-containing protein [Paraburkholderia sp.]TAL96129.1 MAG: DUF1120 domain-containing protein [Paraburkholderia sp.]
MKLVSKNTLLAALLAATSYGAFAADSVDLQVIGTIVPAACTPTIAGGGVIDYGRIPAASLDATGFTVLDVKQSTLTITCDSAVKIGFKTTDNRQGSAVPGLIHNLYPASLDDSYTFGLGTVGGKSVGSYYIKTGVGTVTADGNTVTRLVSDDSGVTWAASGAGIQRPGIREMAWAPTGSLVPGTYATITQPLEIRAGLNKKTDLPDLSNEIPLDGLATFTLVYL